MSSQGELVAGEMVMDSEMKWGVWDWVRASSGCLSVFGLELGGPCGVVGLSSLWSGGDWLVSVPGGSSNHLKVWVARSKAIWRVRRMLLQDPGLYLWSSGTATTEFWGSRRGRSDADHRI